MTGSEANAPKHSQFHTDLLAEVQASRISKGLSPLIEDSVIIARVAALMTRGHVAREDIVVPSVEVTA